MLRKRGRARSGTSTGVATVLSVLAGQSFSYLEGKTTGYVVGTVSATDPIAVTGFRFGATSTATSADGFFTISSAGVITLTAAGAAANAASNDYETAPNTFSPTVQAGNALAQWSTAVAVTINVLDVDDVAPVVTASQSFNYAENKTVGYVVGTVAATDNVGVTGFRFTSTATATSSDGFYSISSAGVVTLTAAGVAGAANDYETVPNAFTHSVQARDAAGNWSTGVNVTFNVTDVAEVSTMPVGMNLAGPNNYNGTIVFKNLMQTMNGWTRQVGSGSFTSDQGTISATVGTDEFTTQVIDWNLVGTVRPTGSYTVLNPAGATVGISADTSTTGVSGGFSTATSFTFTYTGGPLLVRVRGSLSKASGPLVIVKTSDLAAYQAGNIWAPEFLSFTSAMGLSNTRFMEFSGASGSMEVNWTDRSRPDSITGYSFVSGGLPWEWLIDLANRLNIDPWICVPARASNAYLDSLFALWHNGTGLIATPGVGNVGAGGLSTSRKLWVENCNEVWNNAPPYTAGWNWYNFYNHPKYDVTIAPATSTTVVTWTACPVTGTSVHTFTTAANRAAGLGDGEGNFWIASFGGELYWEKTGTNTGFFRYPANSGGTPVAFPVGSWGNIALKVAITSEAAQNNDSAFGLQTVNIWTRAATQMGGTTRLKRVMGAMAAVPAIAAARLAVTGGAANCDATAFAPYFMGEEVIGYVDRASGSLTPKVYASQDGTFYVNIYAGGTAQPSEEALMAGTGALHSQVYPYTLNASGLPHTLTAKTGLTNLTNYEVFESFKSNDPLNLGVITTLHATVSPNATPSTAVIYDTTANQKLRNIIHQTTYGLPALTGHKAVIAASGNPAIIPVAYEDGNHLDSHYETPELKTWLYGTYLESADYVDAMSHHLNQMAANGLMLDNWYEDVHGGSFSIANSHVDTTDPRYVKFVALAGGVPRLTQVTASNITPTGITAAPTYPYTVASLPGSLSYQIVSGNLKGNYDISGTTLRMVNGNGVNFGVNNTVRLYIRATDNLTSAIFQADFSTGPANEWESGAIFYFDSIADSSATAMNPSVGSAMAKAGGPDATVSGGLWTAPGGSGTDYNANPAMTASLSFASNWMLEIVLNKGTLTGGFNIPVFRIGGSAYLQIGTWGGDTSVSCQISNGTSDVFCDIAWDATTHAFWYAFDVGTGLITFGKDQTTIGTQAAPAGGWPASMAGYVQYQGRGAKWGTTQVVQQAGLTVTQAKAVVAKLQTKHSIP
jgi:hypothetical protein